MDLPRAWDASVLSLPFRLPLEAPTALDSDGDGSGGTPVPRPPHAKSVLGGGAELGSDMGISGGLGSGSSLGTRADQALLTFKHATAAPAGEDGGEGRAAATLVRDAPAVPVMHPTAEDEDALVNDLLLLHALETRSEGSDSSWRARLVTTIPGMGPGLSEGDVAPPASLQQEATALLTCPYTQHMAALHPWLRAPTLLELERPALGGQGDTAATEALEGDEGAGVAAPSGEAEAHEVKEAKRGGGRGRQPVRPAGVAVSVAGSGALAAAAEPADSDAPLAGVHPVTGAPLAGWAPALPRAPRPELGAIIAASSSGAPQLPSAVEALQAFLEAEALEAKEGGDTTAAAAAAATEAQGLAQLARMPLPGAAVSAASSTRAEPSVAAASATTQAQPAPAVRGDADDAMADDAEDALEAILSGGSVITPSTMAGGTALAALGGGPRRPLPATPLPRTSWAVTARMTPEDLAAAEARFDPVLKFSFPLDAFQREAIAHMELEGTRADIFVAAHTSAGKTVVAEYAIAQAIAHRSRAIYTSPIKALSNQKFNDLKRRFGGPDGTGVGLVTGDVRINGDASCLVMTTEILRSMLYRSDPVVRETEWVIFDEMHYINDEERGIVYEEVLLLLPRTVGLIFLSATAPNREQFAEWVGRIKQKPVYVLATAKRPIPLNHWLYVNGHLTLLMDGQKMDTGDVTGWHGEKYRALAEYMKKREKPGAARTKEVPMAGAGGVRQRHKEGWGKLLAVLDKQKLLPTIVFTFSRAAVDECAYQGISPSLKLTTAKETAAIRLFFDACVRKLAPVDRSLPQIGALRELLSRGIGTHHAGMLPIMKEVVEILFARGLLKILFCTETIAMGVNLPARSVVFNGLRKPEQAGSRYLLPAEYTQMAGRAGRRGLDVRGTVIIMVWGSGLPPDREVKSILAGSARNLTSQFRLTWNLMLNLIRTDIPVTQFMSKSFAEFGAQKALAATAAAAPAVVQQATAALAARRAALARLTPPAEGVPASAVASFYKGVTTLQRRHMALMSSLVDGSASSVLPSLLAAGRLVILDAVAAPVAASGGKRRTFRFLPAVVLGYETNEPPPGALRLGAGGSGTAARPSARLVLTVAALFPPGYTHEARTPGAAATPAATASAPASAAKGKKGGDDYDDLDDLMGGIGGKKGGKGGGKGGKGGGGGSGGGDSAAAPSATPAAPVKPGHYQPLQLGGAARTVGVLQVRWADVARVSSVALPAAKGGGGASSVLAAGGSVAALEATVEAMWQALTRHGAEATLSATPAPAGAAAPVRPGCAAGAVLRLPPLHPPSDLKPPVQDVALVMQLDAVAHQEQELLAEHPYSASPWADEHWAAYEGYARLKRRLREAKKQTGAQALRLFGEMRSRFALLRTLGYTRPGVAGASAGARRRPADDGWDSGASSGDEDDAGAELLAAGGLGGGEAASPAFVSDIVGLKGRVAAEVNTCDELLFTEMVFQNVLGPLTPAECAALLSALVTQESRLRRLRLAVEVEGSGAGEEGEGGGEEGEQPTGPVIEAPGGGDGSGAAGAGDAAASAAAPSASPEEPDEPEPEDIGFAVPGLDEAADAELLAADASAGGEAGVDAATAALLEAAGEQADAAGEEAEEAGEAPAEATAPANADISLPTQPLHEIVATAARRRPITAVPASLAAACEQLRRLALELGRVQREAGLVDSEEEHADKVLNFGLVVPTYAWACGQTFAQVCAVTDCMEGALVRTMSRLEETCREVRNAARIMGDPGLLAKMEAASACIKRDIVFAASLYFA